MAKSAAEEKLLKILEKNQSSEESSASVSSKSLSKKKTINVGLKQLNPVLILLLILSLVYLGYVIQQGIQLLKTDVTVEAENKLSSSEVTSNIPRAKSIEFYLSQFDRRNIFKPYTEKVEGSEEVVSEGLAIKMNKFDLVGVAWLDLPESASIMLEDTESGKTHFLKEGDKIEDVTVKTIYVDRVVFSYQNEEIVFKL